MLRVTFKSILLYILLKYILFYIFLMFKNDNFSLIEFDNLKGGHTLMYFLLIMLPLPIISMILFSAPLYFAFKVKNVIYFILIVSAILVAEYFIYTYLASQADSMNGVYNGIISLLLLLLFFFKPIFSIFNQRV
jgi:hypothetical protein